MPRGRKKGAPSRTCSCKLSKAHHGRKRRLLTTQTGDLSLTRVYFRCVKCQLGGYPVDERLGLCGRYSPHAQRLICLAAGSWSYDIASERLEDLCGLKVSDTTIREMAQQHGAQANAWLREEPVAVQEFREADGDVEFTTDGTCVNTTEGWREMKVGIFSKRDRGEPATPNEWDTRALPAPKTRIAFAAIEDCQQFGSRWKAWRKRLGLPDTSAVTVLADGAKWIWEQQRAHLRDADGVLDIYHALQHVSDLGKVLHPDPAAAQHWTAQARERLLQAGWSGIETFVQPGSQQRTEKEQTAVDALLDYLAPHQDHLSYAPRLAEGRSIGSGQVEGACKNLIGRRLKANAARWRVRRVNRMAGLCSLLYSHQWHAYWESL
ncbi:MAG: ISKra4 family transposase [Planctomycetaceae bacterium]|nr:ISKra4 family transposase [Planctomycetaceae bacterium]